MSLALATELRKLFSADYYSKPENAKWKAILLGNRPAPGPVNIKVLLSVQPHIAELAKKENASAPETAVAEAVAAHQGATGLSIVEQYGQKQVQLAQQQPAAAAAAAAPTSAQQQQQQHSTTTTSATAAAVAQNDDDAAEDDVDSRSVFASPVHFKASEQQIVDFFSQFGPVTAVERRKFIERGVARLRPSVFVTFKTRQDAVNCVAQRPSYGSCETGLGALFVPRLTVSLKGDPVCRDAMAGEEEKQQQQSKTQLELLQQQGGGAAAAAGDAGADAGPSRRKLINRGCVLAARSVPVSVPQNEVHSRLGSIRGAEGAIDAVHMPKTTEQFRVCYVYCKTAEHCKQLLAAYKRVFSNNEPYAVNLGKSVPDLEQVRDAEEDVAMELYAAAVEKRTREKMEKNAQRRQRKDI